MKINSWEKRNITVFRLQYDMITILNSSPLCLQFIVPETTTNWTLIGGLAGAGAVVLVVIIIVITCVFRKRREKKNFEFAAREEELEMKERGKAVAGELIQSDCYNNMFFNIF